MEVTVKLLQNAMEASLQEGRPGDGWANGKGRFLVDGFPRKMDQALKFDEEVQLKSAMCGRCTHTISQGLFSLHGDFLPNDGRSHAQTPPQTWRD